MTRSAITFRTLITWALSASFGLLVACSDPPTHDAPAHTYDAGPAVCAPKGERAPKMSVFPNIQAIDSAANQIVSGAGYLWVVESTSNTVSRFDPESGRFSPYFIDVGDGRNPYDIAIDAQTGRAYITNWLSNTLSVADLETGQITDEVGKSAQVFDAPQAVAMSDTRIYVANSAYRGPGDYGPGSVTVLARDNLEVLGKVDTAHRNTAFVEVISTPEGPRVVVVDTGILDVNNDGAFVRSAGGVEVWEETDNPIEPMREVFTIETTDDPRMGAPGQPVATTDGRTLYLPSATAPVLFKLDLVERRWLRDTSNPIVLHETDRDGAHNAAIDSRGILYVTAFNEDALYLVDTTCDAVLAGPIRVDQTNSQLEGPQALTIMEAGEKTRVFFVMTLSNAMGKMELDFGN